MELLQCSVSIINNLKSIEKSWTTWITCHDTVVLIDLFQRFMTWPGFNDQQFRRYLQTKGQQSQCNRSENSMAQYSVSGSVEIMQRSNFSENNNCAWCCVNCKSAHFIYLPIWNKQSQKKLKRTLYQVWEANCKSWLPMYFGLSHKKKILSAPCTF